jgi:hypothetical protein
MSRIISIFFWKLESTEDINLNTFIAKVAAFMEAVSLEHSSQGKVFWKLPYTWTNGELT